MYPGFSSPRRTPGVLSVSRTPGHEEDGKDFRRDVPTLLARDPGSGPTYEVQTKVKWTVVSRFGRGLLLFSGVRLIEYYLRDQIFVKVTKRFVRSRILSHPLVWDVECDTRVLCLVQTVPLPSIHRSFFEHGH